MLMVHVDVQQYNLFFPPSGILLRLQVVKHETIGSRVILRLVKTKLAHGGIIQYCYYFRLAMLCGYVTISQPSTHH
jgi:hypothetical protein